MVDNRHSRLWFQDVGVGRWFVWQIDISCSYYPTCPKADKEDLADWEEKNATSRNEGLFFKRLHKASPRDKDMTTQGSLESDPFESDDMVRDCVIV